MRAEHAPPGPPPPNTSGPVVLGTLLLTCGAITASLLIAPSGPAFVYSKFVDEVMSRPWAFEDHEIRVEGDLVQGSIEFREDEGECEHRFVIERGGYEMPVRFPRCVVPDVFRDDFDLEVVVAGSLDEHGMFHADEIIPRCPRHYDLRQPSPHGPAQSEGNGTAVGDA